MLVKRARKIASQYELMFGEEIPTTELVSRLAAVMQEYTQSGQVSIYPSDRWTLVLFSGVRPFGVSLLIAGWDTIKKRPLLFQSDPSGAFFAWKATALGKNDINAKTFLEKRFNEGLELDDGIHTALLTLRESFDVGMTDENVEIAVCTDSGFRRLTRQQIKDHLSALWSDLAPVYLCSYWLGIIIYYELIRVKLSWHMCLETYHGFCVLS